MQSIHGDGISDHFFELLWSKDELNFGPSVYVPDTVVYRYGKPYSWYFTGIDGKMKKKNKTNLVNQRIEEAFTKRVVGCDLVACYIETINGVPADADAPASPYATSRIEYLDRKGLHDFLYNRFKQESGILQRFVEPQGTSNTMVRAIWSPKVCLLERRQNVNQLADARFGLYERAVTYEGPEFLSVAAPLRGAILPSAVQALCEDIVSHISEVSYQKSQIARMVLNFKIDSRERIWLLYSSSIRLASEMTAQRGMGGSVQVAAPLNIDNVVKLPLHVKLDNKASHEEGGRSRRVLRFQKCISCAGERALDTFHPTTYKTVVGHFDQVLLLMAADPLRRGGPRGKAVVWPPDASVVAAAGGVGFGMSRFNFLGKDKKGGKGSKGKVKGLGRGGGRDDEEEDDDDLYEDDEEYRRAKKEAEISAEDVTIPPILRHLHPKLSASVYARYRKDPLFLYKTAVVCEDCYLVFAEMASAPSLSDSLLRQRSSSAPSASGYPPPPPGGRYAGRSSAEMDWTVPSQSRSSGGGGAKRRGRIDDGGSQHGGMSTGSLGGAPPSFPGAIHDASGIAGALQASYGTYGSGGGGGSDASTADGGPSSAEGRMNVEVLIKTSFRKQTPPKPYKTKASRCIIV